MDSASEGEYLPRYGYSEDNVSDPPTDAELDTAFGAPASVYRTFMGLLNDNGDGSDIYICVTDGTSWFYSKYTKAL